MSEPVKCATSEPRAGEAELPYRLDLWDEAGQEVVQVLAFSSTSGIGYAAYYAAMREHLGRHITLSRDDRVIATSGR
ncbi:hypothetical protein ACO2Q0_13285 [Phenylobacterium sp. VNQ135]|uniref:hypothetical protein n=1 Tax=Phenylobacterium sp. VNQ135 TaxID=3400922 RepID=UPI003C087105